MTMHLFCVPFHGCASPMSVVGVSKRLSCLPVKIWQISQQFFGHVVCKCIPFLMLWLEVSLIYLVLTSPYLWYQCCHLLPLILVTVLSHRLLYEFSHFSTRSTNTGIHFLYVVCHSCYFPAQQEDASILIHANEPQTVRLLLASLSMLIW